MLSTLRGVSAHTPCTPARQTAVLVPTHALHAITPNSRIRVLVCKKWNVGFRKKTLIALFIVFFNPTVMNHLYVEKKVTFTATQLLAVNK